MALDYNLYVHDSDKAALAALKAIPGFSQVMKAFMKVWNEKQERVLRMSSNVRLGENQMKKYYDMLPPICDKLGIKVPEMYVELDPFPNAYTYGDTNPFIVLTTGLFETIPDELIPTVIAHECGHIACHHSLYHSMGRALANGAGIAALLGGLGNIAMTPIKVAFMYWMRCSEYSADRASIICDGGSEKLTELCMRLAGCDKDIKAETSIDSFVNQAKEYKDMIDDSAWNKTLEFLLVKYDSHPFIAVRAYEGREWASSERFQNIQDYLNSPSDKADQNLPIHVDPNKFIGKPSADANLKFLLLGFTNVTLERTTEGPKKARSCEVVSISINGNENPKEDYYKKDSEIIVKYYENMTPEEVALAHEGEILVAENSKSFIGRDYVEVHEELKRLGFLYITDKETPLPKIGKKGKEGTVARLAIGQETHFDENSWFTPETGIILYYYGNN